MYSASRQHNPVGLLQVGLQSASARQKTFTNSAGGLPGHGGAGSRHDALVVVCEIDDRARNNRAIPTISMREFQKVCGAVFIDGLLDCWRNHSVQSKNGRKHRVENITYAFVMSRTFCPASSEDFLTGRA